ncbi:MAG: hypothetical protein GY838_17350 [bacterium]|nr:hypothetical protein [bacterium]
MLRRPVLAVIPALLILTTTPSLAQNRYFDDGANGITAQGGWVKGDEADGFGGAATLTFGGRFDVGVSYVTPEQELAPGINVDWRQISPRFAIALVRPEPRMPVGIDVAVSYTAIEFDGMMSDLIGGNAQTVGLEFPGRFGGHPKLKIVPAFGIHYHMTESWRRNRVDDPKLTVDNNGPMISVEMALLFYERFLIVPGTSAFDGDTTWSITAGFALELE